MARKKTGYKVSKYRVWNIVAAVLTLICLVAVVWLDVNSGFWQEMVILSGVAAGLVTFLLTAFFLEDAVARREHRKWFPVTRLALTDLLHTLADDEKSDLHRRQIIARTMATDVPAQSEALDALLRKVVAERDEITEVLARWAQFLSASADVAELMTHIAVLAESLDLIRDEVIELEAAGLADSDTNADLSKLRKHLRSYNEAAGKTINEILRIQDELDNG